MRKIDSELAKKLVPVAVAVLLIGALTAGGVFYEMNRDTTTKVTMTPKEEAISLYGEKKYDEAITKVDAVIAKEPANAEQYNFKANILRDKEDYAGAKENYNKAVELNPSMLAPYVNAASMYINQGDKAAAKEIIERGLKQFPEQKTLEQLKKDAA